MQSGNDIHIPGFGSSTPTSTATTSSTLGTVSSHAASAGDEVDVYTAIADGNPVRVVVSG